MRTTLEFWRELLDRLFPRGERVLVHEIDLFRAGPGARRSQSLSVEDAVAFVCERLDQPNLYFSPAVFNDSGDTSARSCVRVRGLGFDLDFGSVGHQHPNFFETAPEAFQHIRSLPLQPSVCWQTGHGIQGFYLFKVAYSLVSARGRSDPVRLALYKTAGTQLKEILCADVACGPERPFRVPGTLNLKPGCEPIRGLVTSPYIGKTYMWGQLQDWLFSHGLKGRRSTEPEEPASVKLEDLPEEVAEDLATSYGEGERSEAFHSQVGRLYVRGYDLPSCQQIMERYSVVGEEKYESRMEEEVERSFRSWRHHAPTPRSRSTPTPLRFLERRSKSIPLADCGSLSPAFEAMLQRYEQQIAGCALAAGTRQAATFLEHAYHPGAKFIADLPCGSGKSTWSLCHMAVHAGPDHQYAYVCRTLDDLFAAADNLQELRPELHVGRYHGFDEDDCRRLCGQPHTWMECSLNNRQRVCRTCEARTRCSYFKRKEQLKADVVCMAHAGFLDLLVNPKSKFLRDRSVIVDEDPSAFRELTFSSNELQGVGQYLNLNCHTEQTASILKLFQGTRAALDVFMCRDPIVRSTYSEQFYAHVNIRPLAYRPTARVIGRCIWRPARWKIPPYWNHKLEISPDRAREILSNILQFFRPAVHGALNYVIHERPADSGFQYVLRRQQGLSASSVPCHRLVIHNGSALLSKQPHSETLTIRSCQDIQRRGQLVTLYVVQANPRRSRTPQNTGSMLRLLRRRTFQRHRRVLVAVASSMPPAERDQLMGQLRTIWPDPQMNIQLVGRGELRGTNSFGDCTLVLLAGSSFFTTVDDMVLAEALRSRRSIPVTDVFDVDGTGRPLMTRGRFTSPALQELYTQCALDEMYQALYRGAVRTDRPVDVVLAIPSALWLRALWMTVLPGFRLGGAYKWQESGTLKPDRYMRGFVNLVRKPEGFEIGKRDAAQMLGYSGSNAWSDNVTNLRHLLQPFYEERNQRVLRRTANYPCPADR